MLEGLVVGLPVDGLVLGREGLAHAVILPDGRKPRFVQQSLSLLKNKFMARKIFDFPASLLPTKTEISLRSIDASFIERKFFIIILEIYINSLKKMACIIMHANWFDMLEVNPSSARRQSGTRSRESRRSSFPSSGRSFRSSTGRGCSRRGTSAPGRSAACGGWR